MRDIAARCERSLTWVAKYTKRADRGKAKPRPRPPAPPPKPRRPPPKPADYKQPDRVDVAAQLYGYGFSDRRVAETLRIPFEKYKLMMKAGAEERATSNTMLSESAILYGLSLTVVNRLRVKCHEVIEKAIDRGLEDDAKPLIMATAVRAAGMFLKGDEPLVYNVGAAVVAPPTTGAPSDERTTSVLEQVHAHLEKEGEK